MPNRNKRGGGGYANTPYQRAKTSFERRYGMSRQEWAKKKKELRREGNGIEIDKIKRRAYQRVY